jgi:hypothetical protein
MLANETNQAKGLGITIAETESTHERFGLGNIVSHHDSGTKSQYIFFGARYSQLECAIRSDKVSVRRKVCHERVRVDFLNFRYCSYTCLYSSVQISATAGTTNASFERHANLRSGSPANGHGAPHTGLSMLMSSGAGGFKLAQPPHSLSVQAPASFAAMSGINSEQQRRTPTGFLEERERQASALAAAGMVAETVSIANDGRKPAGIPAQGLHAPPPLATGVPMMASAATTEIDSANWGLMDMGGVQLDDMDLDFATLFDPALEEANMQMEGSGWPSTASAPSTPRDVPVSPTSLATMQQQQQQHQHLKPAPPTSGNPS